MFITQGLGSGIFGEFELDAAKGEWSLTVEAEEGLNGQWAFFVPETAVFRR